MTHDPLCEKPIQLVSQTECFECDLIKSARSDERKNITNYVLKLKPRNRIWILRSIKRKNLYWNLGAECAIDVILNHPLIKMQSKKEVENEYR